MYKAIPPGALDIRARATPRSRPTPRAPRRRHARLRARCGGGMKRRRVRVALTAASSLSLRLCIAFIEIHPRPVASIYWKRPVHRRAGRARSASGTENHTVTTVAQPRIAGGRRAVRRRPARAECDSPVTASLA